MNHTFDIPVNYKGKDLQFPACLQMWGYSYRIEVELNGKQIFLEPDEEKNYRAVMVPFTGEAATTVDVELLKKLVEAIESIVK